MKQFILASALLFSCLVNYAQELSDADQVRVKELRKKARTSRITGVVFVATGSSMTVVGLYCLLIGTTLNKDDAFGYPSNDGDDVINVGKILIGAGAGVALTSIPFFMREGRLLREVKDIKLKMKSNTIIMPVNGARSIKVPQIQLSLSIPLGS